MDTPEPASDAPSEPALRLADDEEHLCQEYGRARLLLSLAEYGVLLGVLGGLTLTGAAAFLQSLSHPPGVPELLTHALFLILVGALTRIAILPFQFISEQWLDRRFGLTCQSFPDWCWEWLARNTVFGLAALAMLWPLVELLNWSPLTVLFLCPAFLLCRPLFYDYVYYPLLACFYPVRFLRHETFSLPGVDKVTLPVFLVQVSHKTRRANASIRLRGSKTAIYVTDTLIDAFSDGEERVVMAHEFGHLYDHLHLEARTRAGVAQAQRKLMLGGAQLATGVVAVLLVYGLAPLLGFHGFQDLSGFPLLAAITLILAHSFSPLLCAEARRDERDADEYALAVTGDVENYVSVMTKLRQINLEDQCSNPISRFLFDTHPSYTERVHLARQYRRRHRSDGSRRKSQHWRGWRNIQHHGRR